jgi:hypothetical protein
MTWKQIDFKLESLKGLLALGSFLVKAHMWELWAYNLMGLMTWQFQEFTWQFW